MSRSIGKPLPKDALERVVRTGGVVNAECDAVIIPEIELVQIPLQMLFPAMLIDAPHTPLEDAEEAFNGVGSHVTTGIFVFGVVHPFVLGERLAGALVVLGFVGMQAAFRGHVFGEYLADSRPGEIVNLDGLATASPLNER
jgi:hypothetical protein